MVKSTKFDKYAAYAKAVQSPREDARFIRKIFRQLSGREPVVLREDFCGTFALCCEWVKLGLDKRAIGLDIDQEALTYGKEFYCSHLTDSSRDRLITTRQDVMDLVAPKADIICALNFSYFLFHSRQKLRQYFAQCRGKLAKDGLLMVDVFGGTQCTHPSVEVKKLPDLTYYWEQANYDPISNRAHFYIHFKPKHGRRLERVFSYDWRLWSIAEIQEIMTEVGFKEVVIYWEGTSRTGAGSGRFNRRLSGEAGLVWLAYVVGRR